MYLKNDEEKKKKFFGQTLTDAQFFLRNALKN